MPSLAAPDLRPLQQPLARTDLRHARRWLREHRQPKDVPAIGLGVAGWVMLVPGTLTLLVGLAGADDPAMPIVGGIMTALGAALLIWRRLRTRDALRRTARMLRFADANGLSYAQRALLGPKPAQALHQGFDWIARDVLRAQDGSEWGVWRYRLQERQGSEQLRGYLEIPWPVDPRSADPLPHGLLEELRHAPLPFDVDLVAGRLTISARRTWDVEDPRVQMLVHRIRSIVAAQRGIVGGGTPLPPMPEAVASTEAGRRHGRAALLTGGAIALAAIGMAFLQAVLRNAG